MSHAGGVRAALVSLLGIAMLASCPGPGSDCERDFDCAGGEVCANNHACVPSGTTYRLVITWTLDGYPASAQTCALIERLELRVTETATGDYASYAPVPCDIGRFTFDKLPGGFDSVRLVVFSDGIPVEDLPASVGPTTGTVSFDLQTAVAPIVDAAMPAPDAQPIVDAGVVD